MNFFLHIKPKVTEVNPADNCFVVAQDSLELQIIESVNVQQILLINFNTVLYSVKPILCAGSLLINGSDSKFSSIGMV